MANLPIYGANGFTGVDFVTLSNGYGDCHDVLEPGCNNLCPPLDQAVAAFLDDVHSRGLENDILLVLTGEFERSPHISGGPGRDHWASLPQIQFTHPSGQPVYLLEEGRPIEGIT